MNPLNNVLPKNLQIPDLSNKTKYQLVEFLQQNGNWRLMDKLFPTPSIETLVDRVKTVIDSSATRGVTLRAAMALGLNNEMVVRDLKTWGEGVFAGTYNLNRHQIIEGTLKYPNGDSFLGEFHLAGGNPYPETIPSFAIPKKGTMTMPSGNSYTGTFDEVGNKKEGSFKWLSGNSYTGTFDEVGNKKEGSFKWLNGDSYTGTYDKDENFEKGTLSLANGDLYTGTFYENKNGNLKEGTLLQASGESYTGTFYENRNPKEGTVSWPNGDSYTGTFDVNGNPKEGTLDEVNGNSFKGKFGIGGREHGVYVCKSKQYTFEGTFYKLPQSITVNGSVVQTQPLEGKITWSNGDTFEGNLKNENEEGMFTRADGQPARMTWAQVKHEKGL